MHWKEADPLQENLAIAAILCMGKASGGKISGISLLLIYLLIQNLVALILNLHQNGQLFLVGISFLG
jgi:hypothetical protein